MSGWIWVDLLIVAIAIGAAISGYRQGAVASALALIGVILGAVAGIMVAPRVMELVDDPALRLFFGMIVLIVLVVIGEAAGMVLGSAARSGLHSTGFRVADSLTGSVLQVIAVLVAAWLLSFPIASAADSRLGTAVGDSRVLGAVGTVAPDWMHRLPDNVTSLLQNSGLVQVMGPFGQTEVSHVEAPDPALAELPVVGQARRSVLKISGVAESCGQNLEGSGFVYAPERVMTNAHVVAGTNKVSVSTWNGAEDRPATVVLFDPETDVAVLDVPGLQAPPLGFDFTPAKTGDDAIALGYPEDGPFAVTPLRIRDRITLQGPDIFQRSDAVSRGVYTVRGQIRSGNSGGPMIGTDGRVKGVVFGAAQDPADDTGFVLTAEEVRSEADAARGLTAPTGTDHCVPA